MASPADKNLIDAAKSRLHFEDKLREMTAALKAGADIDVRFSYREEKKTTILHVVVSASPGSVKVAEWVLKNGADINSQCSLGFTPLMHAIENDQMTKLLLDHGADMMLGSGEERGNQLPFLLVAHGSAGTRRENTVKTLELYLSKGADIQQKDGKGENAMDYALQHGFLSIPPDQRKNDPIIKFLRDHGVSPTREWKRP